MKYNKGSLSIIAIIMAIAVLGIGAGSFYYTNKVKNDNKEIEGNNMFDGNYVAPVEDSINTDMNNNDNNSSKKIEEKVNILESSNKEDKKETNESNTDLIKNEYTNILNYLDENAEKSLLEKNKDFVKRVINKDENYLILKTDALTDIILKNINPVNIEKCEPKCDFKKYRFYGYYPELNIYVIYVNQPDVTDFIYFNKKNGNQIKLDSEFYYFYGIPIFSPSKMKFLDIGNQSVGFPGLGIYKINNDKTFYKIFDSNERNIKIDDSYEKVRWLNENEIELKKRNEIKWINGIKYENEIPSEIIKVKDDNNYMNLTQLQAESLVHEKWGDCSSGDCASVLVTLFKNNEGKYEVTAVFNELDDSVSQTQKISLITWINGKWVLGEPTITRICNRGNADGSEGWTTGLCI